MVDNDWLYLTCQQIRKVRWLAVNLPWAATLVWPKSNYVKAVT